ncbi:MAG: cysteine hydrolase [Bacteroidales bacterium]|nr:cysteine hydrolase [Candidatus Sodaliphilus aphodohippi]
MKKLNKPAILVVDMLNDFVTGALACDRGKAIVPATARLLDAARAAGVPVIFCNDAHIKGIDRELKLWGDHAIAGTPGAEVIPELKVCDKDYTVPKRRYSGFFQTDLDILLKELGVQTVVMTGLHAHMCVRHTSADAYCLGYDVVVAKEATDSFTEEDYLNGLEYLKTCYGADAFTNEELIKML